MILKEVIIHKYKSIEKDQRIQFDKDTSILVGMNELGKTAILECIAKLIISIMIIVSKNKFYV